MGWGSLEGSFFSFPITVISIGPVALLLYKHCYAKTSPSIIYYIFVLSYHVIPRLSLHCLSLPGNEVVLSYYFLL